jgi:imidazolonepropionase-like amidohydrolase
VRLGVEAALVRGEIVPGDVDVEDGRVVAVGLAKGPRGRVAIPGFVDLQVNGYGGVDFLSASSDDYCRAGRTSKARSSRRTAPARIRSFTCARPTSRCSTACSTLARSPR